ncbi:MAG: RNA polymerase factor sigma-54 [Bacteroidia bacterium]
MLKQSLQQKMLQKLSPQQIQLMKLLQVPTIMLEQRIKEELEINPALEEGPEEDEDTNNSDLEDFSNNNDEFENERNEENSREDFDYDLYFDDDEVPAYKLNANNTSPDEEKKDIPFSIGTTLHDNLYAQIGLKKFNEKELAIAETIVGNIDDDGYLRRDIPALVDDLAFTQNINCTEQDVLNVLKEIQEFEPAGVGARNLQECLLIQLRRKFPKTYDIKIATEIIEHHFEEFSKKHYDKIAKKLEIEEDALKGAFSEILKLNPKPGIAGSESKIGGLEIVPDFIITNNDGNLELSLNTKNAPELKISKAYKEMLESYSKSKDKSSKEAANFVKQKIESAKWFIDAIKQRQLTLMLTMKAIFDYQKEFFLEGDETKLKPMILKDIADITGLDISTVSRVVNSKYVQTEFGTIPLKFFFSESLSTESGEEVSTREVKKILQDCIAAEDKRKPLTDDALMKILNEKGYNIARRTVAKYREQLNIPVARLRKEL